MRRKGFLSLDVILGTILALMLVAGFSLAVRKLADARSYVDAQRLVRLAAEHEVNRLRAGITFLPPAASAEQSLTIEPGIHLQLSTQPGEGLWAGMHLVTVRGSKTIRGGREVRIVLKAYVDAEGSP